MMKSSNKENYITDIKSISIFNIIIMKISVSDIRWLKYNSEPNPDSYKGFSLKGTMKTKPGIAQLTFTNGEKDFEVIGNSIEDAFIKGFDIIDSFES